MSKFKYQMITDPYESWLAKQAAKGRTPPDTTAPYFAPEKECGHAGCYLVCEIPDALLNGPKE